MASVLVAITLMAVLVFSIGSIAEAQAYHPYYTTGDHIIKLTVKPDSDCWNELYVRSTPKNNNHVLLNFVYIPNNDKPDAGPSETVYVSYYFKDAKMVQTKSTNEGRIRTYVTIELVNEQTGQTVTKYLPYDKEKKTLDFGTFFLHTDKSLCQ
jgi:hypothetical protein